MVIHGVVFDDCSPEAREEPYCELDRTVLATIVLLAIVTFVTIPISPALTFG